MSVPKTESCRTFIWKGNYNENQITQAVILIQGHRSNHLCQENLCDSQLVYQNTKMKPKFLIAENFGCKVLCFSLLCPRLVMNYSLLFPQGSISSIFSNISLFVIFEFIFFGNLPIFFRKSSNILFSSLFFSKETTFSLRLGYFTF